MDCVNLFNFFFISVVGCSCWLPFLLEAASFGGLVSVNIERDEASLPFHLLKLNGDRLGCSSSSGTLGMVLPEGDTTFDGKNIPYWSLP